MEGCKLFYENKPQDILPSANKGDFEKSVAAVGESNRSQTL